VDEERVGSVGDDEWKVALAEEQDHRKTNTWFANGLLTNDSERSRMGPDEHD
jgi:hypothetical protein